MALDDSKIYLEPKAWPSSLYHFQDLETHTYYSKTPSGTDIPNHRLEYPQKALCGYTRHPYWPWLVESFL
jgi:hypothetical protein